MPALTLLFDDVGVGEDLDATLPLLQARMSALPEVPEDAWGREDIDRDALVRDFLGGPHAAALPDETAEDVAELIVDFRCDAGDGRPLRWSPPLVVWFLLDWVPRKVIRPPEVMAAVPDVLAAWVHHAATMTGAPDLARDETSEAVADCRAEFAELALDPTAGGPAKRAVARMLRDGVDVEDGGEVRRWLARIDGLDEVNPF